MDYSFDEFLAKMKKELRTEQDFNDLLLDTAIKSEISDDKRLLMMIAKKGGDITNIILDSYISPKAVLPLTFEKKIEIYRYLCAVENGLKQSIENLV